MHASTFEYLKPTDDQITVMNALRVAASMYAKALDELLPDGPDKTATIRNHRTTAMWANVAVTRHADGSPRQ